MVMVINNHSNPNPKPSWTSLRNKKQNILRKQQNLCYRLDILEDVNVYRGLCSYWSVHLNWNFPAKLTI